VLVEALACGTPVIATPVGGSPEVVTSPEAGVLMTRRTPEALADAVHALFSAYPERSATRRYAETFTWRRTTDQHLALMERALGRSS